MKKKDFTISIGMKRSGAATPDKENPEPAHSVDTIPSGRGEIRYIELARIVPSRYQPRKHFSEDDLQELATSIKNKGVLQPASVFRAGEGAFELIAGERRWRAAKIADLEKLPCIVYDQRPDADEISLIENIQREDLLPEDIALSIAGIMDRHNYNQQQIAAVIGKDKAEVSKYCSIAQFVRNSEVKDYLEGIRSGSSVTVSMEILYMAAKNESIKDGLAFLKKATATGMTVRAAREIDTSRKGKRLITLVPKMISNIQIFNKRLLPEQAEHVKTHDEATQVLQAITATRESLNAFEKRLQARFPQ